MGGFNLLNTELNESGIYSLNTLIKLKLLNYFCLENKFKSIFELNHILSYSFFNVLKKDLNAASFLNLPNRVFFESSNVFLNNSGNYKKTVKIVPATNKSKENWHVIRKILSSLSNLNLNSNHNNQNKLTYKINNYNSCIKFTGL